MEVEGNSNYQVSALASNAIRYLKRRQRMTKWAEPVCRLGSGSSPTVVERHVEVRRIRLLPPCRCIGLGAPGFGLPSPHPSKTIGKTKAERTTTEAPIRVDTILYSKQMQRCRYLQVDPYSDPQRPLISPLSPLKRRDTSPLSSFLSTPDAP